MDVGSNVTELVEEERSSILNDHRAYRDALGAFATGVTLVTALGSQGPVGMTANSFTSVSLEPALVLWSLAKSSGRFAPFEKAKNFSIHILGAEQKELALTFARNGNAFDAFEWEWNDHEVPILGQALARFDCTQYKIVDAGDHMLILGCVDRFESRAGDALIFQEGRFYDLGEEI